MLTIRQRRVTKKKKYQSNDSSRKSKITEDKSGSEAEVEAFSSLDVADTLSEHGSDDSESVYDLYEPVSQQSVKSTKMNAERLKRKAASDVALGFDDALKVSEKNSGKGNKKTLRISKSKRRKEEKTAKIATVQDALSDDIESRSVDETESMTVAEILNNVSEDEVSADHQLSSTQDQKIFEDLDADYEEMRNELSNMPIADLLQLKEKLGAKMYDELMYGTNKKTRQQHLTKRTFSRENKNRPAEMSSRKPVSFGRSTSEQKLKYKSRDPRFDNLSGEFSETHFKQSYSFLSDIRVREKQKLVKTLKKTKDTEKVTQLQQLLTRMTQQEKAEKERDKKHAREQAWKQQEKQFVIKGKRPYFLKKSEKKKIELAEKFQQLESSGKLDQYIAKKKKKNLQVEKKNIPIS